MIICFEKDRGSVVSGLHADRGLAVKCILQHQVNLVSQLRVQDREGQRKNAIRIEAPARFPQAFYRVTKESRRTLEAWLSKVCESSKP